MKSTSVKPTRSRRAAPASGSPGIYSRNPIIERFLQLTIQDGQSVRGVSLSYCMDSSQQVVFSLGDGSSQTLVSGQDTSAFMECWKDACDFVKRLRGIHLSPAL
ncbi:MAG: hypothetical protein EOP87_09575 [Verrucomicrobiaceae bacterium]|nr:MAG: hypothetical protein EOP87_09575 [Verrucomicrobiaceae bacterium]